MAQTVRPSSDHSNDGWTTETGGTTGLAAKIGEAVRDDSTLIRSPTTLAGEAYVVQLGAFPSDPASGQCTLRYTYGKDAASGPQVNQLVELLDTDGETVLESWTHEDVGVYPNLAEQSFTRDLSAGPYFLRFTASSGARTGTMSIAIPAPTVVLLSGSNIVGYYHTTFSSTCDPLNTDFLGGGTPGLDWADMKVPSANFCCGKYSSQTYGDPTAIVKGTWAANQSVWVVLQDDPNNHGDSPELEIRLRSVISAHVNRGYEILFALKTDAQAVTLVRWDGDIGDFHVIGSVSLPNGTIVDGDELAAQIVGNEIRAFRNGEQITNAVWTDSTWTDGNPGIGVNYANTGKEYYGFAEFEACDGPLSPRPKSGDTILFDTRAALRAAENKTDGLNAISTERSGEEYMEFTTNYDGRGTHAIRCDYVGHGENPDQMYEESPTFIVRGLMDDLEPHEVYVQWTGWHGRTATGGGRGGIGAFQVCNPGVPGSPNAGRKMSIIPREAGNTDRIEYVQHGPAPDAAELSCDARSLNYSGTWSQQAHINRPNKYTIYAKAETTEDANDGIYRLWINGVLEINATSANIGPLPFVRWQFPNTYNTPAIDQTEYWWDVIAWTPE